VQYSIASAVRFPGWWLYPLLLALGTLGIAAVWWLGGSRWAGLLSSLIGMAFGGGMIWSVRIVAGGVLGKEAMGFGDVTLMAMVGAFLGWQPALMIFPLAPFVAVFIALTQWVLTRRRDIAFGPYLCVATMIVVVRWRFFWDRAEEIFSWGWFIPQLLFFCLILLAGMLSLVRLVERALGIGRDGAADDEFPVQPQQFGQDEDMDECGEAGNPRSRPPSPTVEKLPENDLDRGGHEQTGEHG
jgi:hypothetical protein